MDKTFKLKSGEALLLTDESERRYFIDFDSSFGYVLITAESRAFYTDKRYLSAAREKLVGWDVEEFKGAGRRCGTHTARGREERAYRLFGYNGCGIQQA